jgi:hypothetical protein
MNSIICRYIFFIYVKTTRLARKKKPMTSSKNLELLGPGGYPSVDRKFWTNMNKMSLQSPKMEFGFKHQYFRVIYLQIY